MGWEPGTRLKDRLTKTNDWIKKEVGVYAICRGSYSACLILDNPEGNRKKLEGGGGLGLSKTTMSESKRANGIGRELSAGIYS